MVSRQERQAASVLPPSPTPAGGADLQSAAKRRVRSAKWEGRGFHHRQRKRCADKAAVRDYHQQAAITIRCSINGVQELAAGQETGSGSNSRGQKDQVAGGTPGGNWSSPHSTGRRRAAIYTCQGRRGGGCSSVIISRTQYCCYPPQLLDNHHHLSSTNSINNLAG